MSEPTDRLDRLNQAARDRSHANLRPRDAASLVIVDTASGGPKILLGRRHPSQVFVPGKFVFPGGRVDPADSRLTACDALPEAECARLLHDMKGRPSRLRARALALAAIRETFEETGLMLARPAQGLGPTRPRSRSPAWAPFLARGVIPDVTALRFVLRAITPPGRPRRYDTRFFLVSADRLTGALGEGDGEFTELIWVSPQEAASVDMHPMTRTVIEDIAEHLGPDGCLPERFAAPYYVYRNGRFERRLIPAP